MQGKLMRRLALGAALTAAPLGVVLGTSSPAHADDLCEQVAIGINSPGQPTGPCVTFFPEWTSCGSGGGSWDVVVATVYEWDKECILVP